MFTPRRLLFRTLCWALAFITPLTPSAVIYAQAPAAVRSSRTKRPVAVPAPAVRTEFIVPGAAVILTARPNQLLTCNATQMMPVEVLTAACLKEFGFDPVKVKSVLVSLAPPTGGPPNYAAVFEFTEHFELASLSPKLTQHTVPADRNGKAYLKSQHPLMPCFYWVDDTTLLAASEQTLEQLLTGGPAKLAPFAKELATGSADDLKLLVNIAGLRPLIAMGLSQAASNVPPQLQGLLEVPQHLQQVRLRISLSGAGPIELSCEANDAQAADQVESLLKKSMDFYLATARESATQMLASDDTVKQATGQYILRIMPIWLAQMTPKRNGKRFTVIEVPVGENALGGTTSIAVIGVLVGLLLPAVQAGREAARRTASTNNMKQLMLSSLIYYDAHEHFPAHANYDKNGKPLLSWRVHLLPHLEEEALYKQFHLDEPWDSAHNKTLISKMPAMFLDPSSGLALTDGRTHYLGALGKGFVFDGTKNGMVMTKITDGTSNTVMLVQVNDESAAIWTKPADWEWNDKAPLTGLDPNLHPGIFQAGFCDGSVHSVSKDIDLKVLKGLFTIAGDEIGYRY